jgi:hypothetical protein
MKKFKIQLVLSLFFLCWDATSFSQNTANAILYKIQDHTGGCYIAGVVHARFESLIKKIDERLLKIASASQSLFVESVKQPGYEYEPLLNPYAKFNSDDLPPRLATH